MTAFVTSPNMCGSPGRYAVYYVGTGGTAVSLTETKSALDSTQRADTQFFNLDTTNKEIDILGDGHHEINAQWVFDDQTSSTGAVQRSVRCRIRKNGTAITGLVAHSWVVNRGLFKNGVTIHVESIYLVAGDVIDMTYGFTATAAADTDTVADHTRIMIRNNG